MKHISDYLYDDDKNFTPEKLITDLGLYEGVLIDTSEMTLEATESFFPIDYKDKIRLFNAIVSNDVKLLHRFLLYEDSLMLPCAECKKDQAYSPITSFNPQRIEFTESLKSDGATDYKAIVSLINSGKYELEEPSSCYKSEYDIIKCYTACEDRIVLAEGENGQKPDLQKTALLCVEGINTLFSEFRRDFVCALNKKHHITSHFIIHKATEVCKEKSESADYEKLKYCLVLEKVGQEPSMADLQMFDIEKYKKVLSNDSFIDFSMALGLYASGVGCGSLLYLRRIYETLIKKAQDNCSKLSEWNEGEYSKKRFNEKLKYLESLGAKIIPDELSDVKVKIYGWLSKGVHELSEQESKELFPALKYSIELILDEQIAQKEKEDKLKELKKTLNK